MVTTANSSLAPVLAKGMEEPRAGGQTSHAVGELDGVVPEVVKARQAVVKDLQPPDRHVDTLTKLQGANAGRSPEILDTFLQHAREYWVASGQIGEPVILQAFFEGKNVTPLNDEAGRQLGNDMIRAGALSLQLSTDGIPTLIIRQAGDEIFMLSVAVPGYVERMQNIRQGLNEASNVLLGRSIPQPISRLGENILTELFGAKFDYTERALVMDSKIRDACTAAIGRTEIRKALAEFVESPFAAAGGSGLMDFLKEKYPDRIARILEAQFPEGPHEMFDERMAAATSLSPYRVLPRVCQDETSQLHLNPETIFGFDIAYTTMPSSAVTPIKVAVNVAKLDHCVSEAKGLGKEAVILSIEGADLDGSDLSPSEMSALEGAVSGTITAIDKYRQLKQTAEELSLGLSEADPAVVLKSMICAAAVDSSNPRIVRRDQINGMSGLAVFGELDTDNTNVLGFSIPVRYGNKEELIGMSKNDEMVGWIMERVLNLELAGKEVWPERITQADLDNMTVVRSSGGDIFVFGVPKLTRAELETIAAHVDNVSMKYWIAFCDSPEKRHVAKVVATLTRADDERRLANLAPPDNDINRPRKGLGFYPADFGRVAMVAGSMPVDYRSKDVGAIVAQTSFDTFFPKLGRTMNIPAWMQPSGRRSHIIPHAVLRRPMPSEIDNAPPEN